MIWSIRKLALDLNKRDKTRKRMLHWELQNWSTSQHQQGHTAVQSQKAASAHLTSAQILFLAL